MGLLVPEPWVSSGLVEAKKCNAGFNNGHYQQAKRTRASILWPSGDFVTRAGWGAVRSVAMGRGGRKASCDLDLGLLPKQPSTTTVSKIPPLDLSRLQVIRTAYHFRVAIA